MKLKTISLERATELRDKTGMNFLAVGGKITQLTVPLFQIDPRNPPQAFAVLTINTGSYSIDVCEPETEDVFVVEGSISTPFGSAAFHQEFKGHHAEIDANQLADNMRAEGHMVEIKKVQRLA